MKRLLVIGIGPGDPEHVTVQAIAALNQVDVFFVLEKGADTKDLVVLRKEICSRFIEPDRQYRFVAIDDPERRLPARSAAGYAAAVEEWHRQRLRLVHRAFDDELTDGQCGAFLVWGDPAIYDSTLRLVDELRGQLDVDVDVVPGISSVQVLAARHRVTLNRIGSAIHITTGRRLAAGLPEGVDDVVVMLDSDCSFRHLAGEWDVYWGAYLGTPDEILVAGRLPACALEIERVRAEARERKGWMFDTYLLRRIHPVADEANR